MRRLLFVGVMALGLAGMGCATGSQSSTAGGTQKVNAPELANPTQLQGRAKAQGWLDNQVSTQNPLAPTQGPMPATGMPQTGFQRIDNRMYNGTFNGQ